jgi:hypothetical protein
MYDSLLPPDCRIRPSSSNRVLIDQTCFGRKGGLAPISLPLFQGVHLLVGEQISLSGMARTPPLQRITIMPPQPEGRETMSAFRGLPL